MCKQQAPGPGMHKLCCLLLHLRRCSGPYRHGASSQRVHPASQPFGYMKQSGRPPLPIRSGGAKINDAREHRGGWRVGCGVEVRPRQATSWTAGSIDRIDCPCEPAPNHVRRKKPLIVLLSLFCTTKYTAVAYDADVASTLPIAAPQAPPFC